MNVGTNGGLEKSIINRDTGVSQKSQRKATDHNISLGPRPGYGLQNIIGASHSSRHNLT